MNSARRRRLFVVSHTAASVPAVNRSPAIRATLVRTARVIGNFAVFVARRETFRAAISLPQRQIHSAAFITNVVHQRENPNSSHVTNAASAQQNLGAPQGFFGNALPIWFAAQSATRCGIGPLFFGHVAQAEFADRLNAQIRHRIEFEICNALQMMSHLG